MDEKMVKEEEQFAAYVVSCRCSMAWAAQKRRRRSLSILFNAIYCSDVSERINNYTLLFGRWILTSVLTFLPKLNLGYSPLTGHCCLFDYDQFQHQKQPAACSLRIEYREVLMHHNIITCVPTKAQWKLRRSSSSSSSHTSIRAGITVTLRRVGKRGVNT